MKIREKHFTIDYLLSNKITFKNWQILAENCFDTDYIDFIDAVMNARIIFNNKLEEFCYQNTLTELMLHRSNIIQQVNNKVRVKRKIHKSA
jgi:hypothetical protein